MRLRTILLLRGASILFHPCLWMAARLVSGLTSILLRLRHVVSLRRRVTDIPRFVTSRCASRRHHNSSTGVRSSDVEEHAS